MCKYACTTYFHTKLKLNNYAFVVIFKSLSRRLIVSKIVKNHWAAFLCTAGYFLALPIPSQIADFTIRVTQIYNLTKVAKRRKCLPKEKPEGHSDFTHLIWLSPPLFPPSQLLWDLWLMMHHF